MVEHIVLGIVIIAFIATIVWIRWDKKRVDKLINDIHKDDEEDWYVPK